MQEVAEMQMNVPIHIKGHDWKLLSLQAGKEVVDRLCAEIRQKTQ